MRNPATRREFLRLTAMAGAGLTLGGVLEPAGAAAEGGNGAALTMPFLRIGPDNTVTVISKHMEMGQGVWTGIPTIVAEELDAAWSQVRVESSPAGLAAYGNLAWDPQGNIQGTGGSTSIYNSWPQLRQAGATARAMLVSAAVRRWGVPAAEVTVREGVVSHQASGRTATFGELATAANQEKIPASVTLKQPDAYTLIGRDHLPRLDSPAKTSGREQYGSDVYLPGMMTAMLVRPPRFGTRVKSFDATATRLVAGVVDVVEVPRGVAVIGRNTWAARKGRDALKVIWDESAAEKRGSAQLWQEFHRLARTGRGLPVKTAGDAGQALARAKQRIDAEFEFPYLAHAPMEPLSAVVRLGPGRCEIWAGSQLQTGDIFCAAAAAGLKPSEVEIHTLAAGGSFGRRANAIADYITETVSIAKAVNGRYPVKLQWTREDDIRGGMYRPMNLHRVEAGLDAAGRLTGLRQMIVGQTITIGTPFEALTVHDGVDFVATNGTIADQYLVPHADVRWINPKVGVPVLWWRSVENTHTAFSKEVIMDELAWRAGRDPVQFRLGHLAADSREAAVLRLAADKAGWATPLPKGTARGIAVHECFGTVVAQAAEVRIDKGRVRVDRVVCAVDCGTVINPDVVRAQMEGSIGFGLGAALHGRITLTAGRVDQRNFDGYPPLRMDEMPRRIEVHVVPSRNPPTGAGEPGVPPIAPAVANALRVLTGRPVRRLPLEI